MDTFIGRTQQGFGKISKALVIAFCFVAVAGLLQLQASGVFDLSASITNVESRMRWYDTRTYGSNGRYPKENARFQFDLDADLTPLFNWNTKQVFVYVTVDYNRTSAKTGTVAKNSVVIWDKIITSKDQAHLKLRKQTSKYSVWDLQKEFGGDNRDVAVNLRWNVQPKAGFLVNGAVQIADNIVSLPEVSKP